jgi:hypothetical protein
MILTATHVLEKLNEGQFLQKAKSNYPDYNLVLAGKSEIFEWPDRRRTMIFISIHIQGTVLVLEQRHY